MKLFINDMLYALSFALDYVEGELLGVKAYHSERVAYLSVRLGKELGMDESQLSALAAAAVLHDNALTEYLESERQTAGHQKNPVNKGLSRFALHCELGERNVKVLPFYHAIQGAILYHHENADGSGLFSRNTANTPIFSQLIHFADTLDNTHSMILITPKIHAELHAYAEKHRDILFPSQLVDIYHHLFPKAPAQNQWDEKIREELVSLLPLKAVEYSNTDVEALASLFAHITDYKSHFTCTHSLGIAQKARRMAEFYNYPEETRTKLYLAGALHDIGKLAVPNEILEKPAQLSHEEFEIMKKHALYSWNILHKITGLDDVAQWASLHHEKLNGKGYPFGKQGSELGHEERLIACIDIYQALTENRPYKEGMNHHSAMKILHDMAESNLIDSQIVDDIDQCYAKLHEISTN